MVAKTREKIEEFYKTYPGYLKKSSKDGLFLLEKRYPKVKFKLEDINLIRKNSRTKNYPENYNLLKKDFPKAPINKEFRRLFWDIETSYNVVSTWQIGYKINISHDNIIKERAVICICYKWAGEDEVHSLQWNKGDDSKLIRDFVKILNSADENIGHNVARFDGPWLKTRALYHGVPMFPQYSTLDTLSLARHGFKFNSNRLDYLGKFMGFGGKKDTGGFKLWQDIVEKNDPKAMTTMIDYCKQDVTLLEKVYNKLNGYTKAKTHAGVVMGNNKCSCPNCGSEERRTNANKVTAAGTIYKQFQCKDCNKYYQVSLMVWNTYSKLNMKNNNKIK